jgi:hypothetical protein
MEHKAPLVIKALLAIRVHVVTAGSWAILVPLDFKAPRVILVLKDSQVIRVHVVIAESWAILERLVLLDLLATRATRVIMAIAIEPTNIIHKI